MSCLSWICTLFSFCPSFCFSGGLHPVIVQDNPKVGDRFNFDVNYFIYDGDNIIDQAFYWPESSQFLSFSSSNEYYSLGETAVTKKSVSEPFLADVVL